MLRAKSGAHGKRRGRPAGRRYRETIPVRLTPETVGAINRWIERQAGKMSRSEAIRRLLEAVLRRGAMTLAGGAIIPAVSGTIDPLLDRARWRRLVADLKARTCDPRRNRDPRWSGELREGISIPSPDLLNLLYAYLPERDRAWYYVYAEQVRKLAILKTQLGADTFWEVALWFAKREVPGFKIASQTASRKLSWRLRRINLYGEVNALVAKEVVSGQEQAGSSKAVDRAIEKIKGINSPAYRRDTEVTLRKQYYLAKSERVTRSR